MEKFMIVHGVTGDRLDRFTSLSDDFGFSIKNIGNKDIGKKIKDLIDLEEEEEVAEKSQEDIEFVLFVNINDDELYDFLDLLRENDLYFPNKAVLTPTNLEWPLHRLLAENKQEHEVMTLYGQLRKVMGIAKALEEEGHGDRELQEEYEAAMDYFHPREFDFDELKEVYNRLAIKVNSILEGLKYE